MVTFLKNGRAEATSMKTPSKRNLPLGPASVATNSLKANPHNPRKLFDELPLKTLEEFIRKVGILVPLTVYRAAGSEKYTILDGQRRWVCAQRIGLPTVPINEVAEPSVAQNIVTMFQIHRLRLDWELMPTALKLEVLMDQLKEKREKPLAELTALDVAVVARCKKLLWYPRRFQNMMLYANPGDRIKADFFIELYPIVTDRTVKKSKKYNSNKLIQIFLEKHSKKLSGIKSVIDFRKIKQALTAARAAGKEEEILKRFEEFVGSRTKEISHLEINTARAHRTASTLTKTIAKLRDEIGQLDVTEFVGEEALWHELERLFATLRKTLEAADRRLR